LRARGAAAARRARDAGAGAASQQILALRWRLTRCARSRRCSQFAQVADATVPIAYAGFLALFLGIAVFFVRARTALPAACASAHAHARFALRLMRALRPCRVSTCS
jgi:hypothetical protein